MNSTPHPALVRAVTLSEELLVSADRGEWEALARFDAERLELLKSFRCEVRHIEATDQDLLQQIHQLNDRALGLMEHHLRIHGRSMDLAAIGRRAVAAYAHGSLHR